MHQQVTYLSLSLSIHKWEREQLSETEVRQNVQCVGHGAGNTDSNSEVLPIAISTQDNIPIVLY